MGDGREPGPVVARRASTAGCSRRTVPAEGDGVSEGLATATAPGCVARLAGLTGGAGGDLGAGSGRPQAAASGRCRASPGDPAPVCRGDAPAAGMHKPRCSRVMRREIQPVPGPATVAEPRPAADGAARAAPPVAELAVPKTARDRFRGRHGRHRQRTGVHPRLADMAATRGEVAAVAHLHGAGSHRTGAPHRRGGRAQDQGSPAGQAARTGAPGSACGGSGPTALDESIVKEITQRKILFRMCYEPARRRGVTATRADVKWVLAADGSVHNVEVAVAQDAQLANCIRAVASRPFAAGVGQDMPVAIPLLFVSAR